MYIPKRLILNDPRAIKIWPLFNKIKKYTLLNYESIYQNYQFIQSINKLKIPGAIVECGVWKGGNGAFMAKVSNRETWLFDSFEGMPEKGKYDDKIKGKNSLEQGDLAVTENQAKEIAKKIKIENKTHIVKGWFKDTLPKYKEQIGSISLLRIDGDFYESTKCVLDTLYDQVSPGGFVIFDDYKDFEGCRKAIIDFFSSRDEYPNILDYYPMGKPYIQKSTEKFK